MDFSLHTEDPVLLWNQATLEAISNTSMGPTPTSRALGLVNTSIYDAWAAYDPVAIGTQLGNTLQVSNEEINSENKSTAISYAAYTTLLDLFPTQETAFTHLMQQLGIDSTITTTDTNTAAGIGNLVAKTLLNNKYTDGSNQLNNYADTTNYQPVNTWDKITDPNRWQPISINNGNNIQKFLTPQWGDVTPFALTSGNQYLPPPPAEFGTQSYIDQALQVIEYSALLTDEQKVIAEYWADGPQTILPPGHWHLIAEYVSTRDNLSLDDNVKLFFSLGNAVSDAGIAAWDAKEYYDYVRPITAIQYLAANNLLPNDHPLVRTNPQSNVQEIYSWAGPDQGSQWIDGTTWLPYQKSTFVTPPFAEYVSGHSTFSAASAEILNRFTNSDELGVCHTQLPNTSTFETNTPSNTIQLCWDTFTSAADQAGISRLYGGIHFQDGDINGRILGRKVGTAVWEKSQYYISGGKPVTKVPEPSPILGLLTSAIFGGVLFKRNITRHTKSVTKENEF
ncbi:DUF6851 domain-containing protein [Rivularia sp. UHCC 0363]|uniref:DUF6851 domain-containing protein n=1 Tax=Rivularia sp. UHCC 0363 TaxID=3110244 RepID=UPI002B20E76F|nr:PEP-CTERM sorting domain-containing protein [Rivularia sp. UHCC 0363]MEA5598705.1 PEP-CTERM sorting domain-containing protein [Rivularia sp. UHCC 0363]